MGFDVEDVRSVVSERVERALAEAELGGTAPELHATVRRYLERPARYIRPKIVSLAAWAYGDHSLDPDGVRSLAASTEILHVFALLHDDRIDEGEANRLDTPTGDSVALPILAGDLLHTIGLHLLSETVVRYNYPTDILTRVRSASLQTIAGQLTDIQFLRSADGGPSREDLYRLYDAKTGRYTILAPLQIGARAAGADPEELERLKRVALPLGRAFQLADDADDLARLHRADTDIDRTPVWELNLAVTWLKTRRNRSASDGRIDRSAVIRSLDMEELQQDVDAWRRELTDEARRAASRLRLPEDRRIALVEQIIAGLE